MSSIPEPQHGAQGDMPISDLSEQSSDIQGVVKELLNVPVESTSETRTSLQTFALLPSADDLAKYPAEIQRIIVIEWVENRKHRTATEARRQRFGFIVQVFGLVLGFTLALSLIVGSVHIILSGYSNEGLIGIGGTVATIAGVFVYTDRRK